MTTLLVVYCVGAAVTAVLYGLAAIVGMAMSHGGPKGWWLLVEGLCVSLLWPLAWWRVCRGW